MTLQACDNRVVNRSKPWLLVMAMVALCAATLVAVIFYRAVPLKPAAMLQRVPTKDSLVAAIDFGALRKMGVLQMLDSSSMSRDPDYEKFVEETQFNYTQDLDYVLASFGPGGKYFLARGRFDWKAIRAYALNHGGLCYNTLCRMTGSTPEKHISFYAVQQNVMALAVAQEDDAALRMQNEVATDLPPPSGALWLYLPPAVLKSPDELPEGTVLFAKSVDQAKSVILNFAPEGDHIAAKLDVLCRNDNEALVTATELSKVTEVLKSMIAHGGHRPDASDLTGVLSSGTFENKGPRVFGYWPIQQSFVENILGR